MVFIPINEIPEKAVECPWCFGRGYVMDECSQAGATDTFKLRDYKKNSREYRARIPSCRVCLGNRVVYLDKICCCGGPATRWDNEGKFFFCGREGCLMASRARAKRANVYGMGA